VWRWNDAHLVTFFAFEEKPCARGVALIVTVRPDCVADRRRARVGDSAARLRSLYPKANLRTGFALEWLLARDLPCLRRGRRRRIPACWRG
jgi:hypothetical protein